MYVQTCNSLADQWAAEFPDRFHIVDSVQLDDESAQRELLSWLGYMPAEVSVRAGLWRERKPPVMSRQRTVAHNPDEILYAATGFLHVRREVYLTIQQKLDLPVCNERYGRPSIPFFQPMVHPIDEGTWYLAEDFAFCERARRCGFKIFADTAIRLRHVGNYGYSWEDAGINVSRFPTFTLNFPQ